GNIAGDPRRSDRAVRRVPDHDAVHVVPGPRERCRSRAVQGEAPVSNAGWRKVLPEGKGRRQLRTCAETDAEGRELAVGPAACSAAAIGGAGPRCTAAAAAGCLPGLWSLQRRTGGFVQPRPSVRHGGPRRRSRRGIPRLRWRDGFAVVCDEWPNVTDVRNGRLWRRRYAERGARRTQ